MAGAQRQQLLAKPLASLPHRVQLELSFKVQANMET
jgi:hypothetical protein